MPTGTTCQDQQEKHTSSFTSILTKDLWKKKKQLHQIYWTCAQELQCMRHLPYLKSTLRSGIK
eukprot:8384172-Ditylum_brightwellii.AAC.1